MRRKWIATGLTIFTLAVSLAAVVWQTSGQNAGGKGAKEPALPIRQVMVFNSGVSYFEREGEIDGDAQVPLWFATSDINDLLKSMLLEDRSGGKISTISYDSHDPIEKVLHSFAVDLNGNPTFSQILDQARGEKIEIVRRAASVSDRSDAKAEKQTGIIVGVEVRKRPTGGGKDALADVDFLNLSGDAGLQNIPLDQVQSVRFLNPVIDSEFQRALKVVAASHDRQKKNVTLGFSGKGKRNVRVGYVIEQPIWKSTYRLRIEPDGKIFVQGWAIVENTSDEDWNDVRMVLVSGRPISFKMDMYEPLYIPRPTAELELYASLRPQIYSGALARDLAKKLDKLPDMARDEPDGKPQDYNRKLEKIVKEQQRVEGRRRLDALEDMKEAEKEIAGEAKGGRRKAEKKDPLALNFKEGIESVASASDLGEYYQYVINQRITLPRQKSAMLPVLNQNIDGQKLSIYNEATHAKYPLLGLRLKNSSKQPLNQGPITVYDDGAYAGDTRILELQTNEERLLSYALDQAVEIKPDIKSTPGPDMSFRMGESSLTARYQMRETKTYTIRNRAKKDRTVLLEHPIRGGWKLTEDMKPVETTRDVYRFQVKVLADATVKFEVIEDQARVDDYNRGSGQPQYVSSTGVNIRTQVHADEEKLLGLRIRKGLATATMKARETKSYFVQNLSEIDRIFTVDHVVAGGWTRIDDKGDPHRGPDVFRFTLKAARGKTAEHSVVEERTYDAKPVLVKELTEEKLHAYLVSPVLSADVKAAMSKVLEMQSGIADAKKNLADLDGQLQQLSSDQSRLRENLKIIPQSSEPFKKLLDKFLTQENEVDGLQKQIRQQQTALQARQREYDTFVAALTAE